MYRIYSDATIAYLIILTPGDNNINKFKGINGNDVKTQVWISKIGTNFKCAQLICYGNKRLSSFIYDIYYPHNSYKLTWHDTRDN